MNALDLFAGPGGWDEGLLELGIRPLGVEWDDSACLTRGAAGHLTVQADVSELGPRDVYVDDGPLDLLIGSPPCPTFSAAGGGSGHQVVGVILECLDALRDGRDERAAARERAYEALLPATVEEEQARARKKNRPFSRARAEEKARRNAAMSLLVVEPFRYALELRPRWIALEQVPPVLPIWVRLAADLRQHGWHVWTGLLSSEQYGVPQTRERAILLADLHRPVSAPAPTHQRYVPPRKEPDLDRLFDPGRRERIVERGEEHLEPWVSMAQALGWVAEERPSRTVCGHHTPRWLYGEQDPREGISVLTRGEDGSRDNDVYDATARPSRAVTGRAYSLIAEGVEPADVELNPSNGRERTDGGGPNPRSLDEPAPTLTAEAGGQWKMRQRVVEGNEVAWVQRERSGDRAEEGFDPTESPAQAVTSKARCWELIDERSPEFNRGPVDPDEQPAPTVSSTARQWRVRNYHAKDDTESHETGGPVSPTFDPIERPARTVTHRVGGWEVEVEEGADPPSEAEVALALGERRWTLRTGDNTMSSSRDPKDMIPYERSLDEPAPTLTAKTGGAWKIAPDGDHVDPPMGWKEKAADAWTFDRPAPTIVGSRRSRDGMLAGRQLPPGQGENVGGWGYERPATVVAGDPRLHPPGHKENAQDPPDTFEQRRGANAVRLSVAEASVLQGFRPDYPWQGSRTKQFEQVGNAVPPPLARACIRALVS